MPPGSRGAGRRVDAEDQPECHDQGRLGGDERRAHQHHPATASLDRWRRHRVVDFGAVESVVGVRLGLR